jgi:hypothetical protein
MRRSTIAAVAVAISALTVPPSNAYTVLPPGSIVDGQSITDWTAAWWSRYWQAPFNSIDPSTGNVPATVNNNGPVFFGPTTDGNPTRGNVTINFSLPYGTSLLVPVLPFNDLEAASIDGNALLADRQNAATIVVAGWLGSVDTTNLFASIDGTPVTNVSSYLEQTGYFSAGPTQAGSIAATGGVTVNDDLYPNEAAGYWLMIEGLTPGLHTVQFGGSSVQFTPDANCCTNFPIGPYGVDVTANIDVVPEPSSILLGLTGILGTFTLRRKWKDRSQD